MYRQPDSVRVGGTHTSISSRRSAGSRPTMPPTGGSARSGPRPAQQALQDHAGIPWRTTSTVQPRPVVILSQLLKIKPEYAAGALDLEQPRSPSALHSPHHRHDMAGRQFLRPVDLPTCDPAGDDRLPEHRGGLDPDRCTGDGRPNGHGRPDLPPDAGADRPGREGVTIWAGTAAGGAWLAADERVFPLAGPVR